MIQNEALSEKQVSSFLLRKAATLPFCPHDTSTPCAVVAQGDGLGHRPTVMGELVDYPPTI